MKIKSFDALALPDYEINDDFPLLYQSSLVTLPGQAGAYDNYGNDTIRAPMTITRSYELIGSSYADIDTQLDALKAKANKGRRWLIAEMRDASERGIWAKLINVSAPFTPENLEHLPIDLAFECPFPWFEDTSQTWKLDAGEVLDNSLVLDLNFTNQSGAGSFTITNAGDDVIHNMLIRIVGVSNTPKITNTTNGYSIALGVNVVTGSTLFIDTGAQAVVLDGANRWNAITLGDTQTSLMRLEVGANDFVFTGGGTLIINWAEVY